MALLRWIVQVLVIMFLVRLALRLVSGGAVRRPTGQGRPAPKPTERIGGALVRDPQCGTYVPKERAIAHGKGDAAQFFCSTACRDGWVAGHQAAAESGRA